MDPQHAPEHQWPDEEPVREERPEPPRSRRERIVRALGDAFLTAGLGRAAAGGREAAAVRPGMNVILFGEGESKGREASRGSGSDQR